MSASGWREDEIARYDHTDGKARADGEGRRNFQLTLDDALAGLVDRVEGPVAKRAGQAVLLVEGEFRADGEQCRKPSRAQDAGPVIVDAVLETGISRRIRPGLAFEDKRSPIWEYQPVPDQEDPTLADGDAVVIGADQAGALGDQQ